MSNENVDCMACGEPVEECECGGCASGPSQSHIGLIKHGHAINGRQSPTYKTWKTMTARCRNPSGSRLENYISRGIVVCEEWRNSFESFLEDMGLRPGNEYSIDRIDNDGNYCKSNCRWATRSEQVRNRRNKKLDYNQAFDIAKRMLQGERPIDLAREYKTSESLPREIVKGRTWKDACEAAKKFIRDQGALK